MLRQSLAAWSCAALLVGASSGSAASGLAGQGQFILGADRLIPLIAYSANSAGSGSSSSTEKIASISLFGNAGLIQTIYNIPRLGLDYAITDSFTIGGDLFAFITLSSSLSSSSGSSDETKITIIGVSPRAGYLVPLSTSAWFWPRVGFTFDLLTTSPPSSSGGNSSTLSQFAAVVEPLFVFSPVQHVGISLGPVVDIPVTGSTSSGSGPSTDISQFHIGLTAGLDVWF